MSFVEYFLNSGSDVIQYELLEISHSSFSQTYRLVRNNSFGIDVTLEDLSSETFSYYPMKISHSAHRSDLEFAIKVDLGDLGELLPKELDSVKIDQSQKEKPVCRYRIYRSDDLSQPLYGPVVLKIESISSTKTGSSFEAKAQSVNKNRTGEKYDYGRFFLLRG